ncbi:hypothetical protein A2U01_0062012 [Trifolium medium]|uniref:Uncharacterized protein n=1 Tax=Trifolium medium TaxID=97028 RepID=A0A392RWM5_9FABA|nr:hypothetical protein [Trifolium medium]
MASLQLRRLFLRSLRFRSISSSPIQPPHFPPSKFSSYFHHLTLFPPPSLFQSKHYFSSESELVFTMQTLSGPNFPRNLIVPSQSTTGIIRSDFYRSLTPSQLLTHYSNA